MEVASSQGIYCASGDEGLQGIEQVEKVVDRRRRLCLKGIHSRSDTNKTGTEGLSFYYPDC